MGVVLHFFFLLCCIVCVCSHKNCCWCGRGAEIHWCGRGTTRIVGGVGAGTKIVGVGVEPGANIVMSAGLEANIGASTEPKGIGCVCE